MAKKILNTIAWLAVSFGLIIGSTKAAGKFYQLGYEAAKQELPTPTEIQQVLVDAGLLDSDDIDGIVGPKTRDAWDTYCIIYNPDALKWFKEQK